MKEQYRFTVFTPCFNSERFIHRVFESLKAQTFRDFEWLVINDASTDGTDEIIRKYAREAEFDINYIALDRNQMITANINLAIEKAKGELFVFAGHDDRMKPEALEEFDKTWREYGNNNLSGIVSLCQDQHGNLVGSKFPQDIMIADYFTVSYKLKYDREKFGCTRTEVLREFPFDTKVSEYVPEGILWGRIGLKYQTIWINKVLRIYYIEPKAGTSLSRTGRQRYSKGINYSYLVWINEFEKQLEGEHLFKLRNKFAYAFYGILSHITFSSLLKPVNAWLPKLLITGLYPFAWVLTKVMQRLGKL